MRETKIRFQNKRSRTLRISALLNKKSNKIIKFAIYIILLCGIVYGTLFLISGIINTYPITDFSERVISLASKNNVDIDKKISHYYFYFLVCCPLIALLLYKILNNFDNLLQKIKHILKCILNIIFIQKQFFVKAYVDIYLWGLTITLLDIPKNTTLTVSEYISDLFSQYLFEMLISISLVVVMKFIFICIYKWKIKKINYNIINWMNVVAILGGAIFYNQFFNDYFNKVPTYWIFKGTTFFIIIVVLFLVNVLFYKYGEKNPAYAEQKTVKCGMFWLISIITLNELIYVLQYWIKVISFEWLLLIIAIIFSIIFFVVGKMFLAKNLERYIYAMLPVAIVPLVTWFFVELVYTFNAYGIVVQRGDIYIFVFYLISFIIFFLRWRSYVPKKMPKEKLVSSPIEDKSKGEHKDKREKRPATKNKNKITDLKANNDIDNSKIPRNKILKLESIIAQIVLLGTALQAVMRTIDNYTYVNLFEGANSGIAVDGFLSHGALPIIDNFDAHMLINSFNGIIYGLITSDKIGAIFSPYTYISVALIIMFYYLVFKEFLGNLNAFILALFFPLSMVTYTSAVFMIGMSAVAYTAYWMKRDSWIRDCIFWIVAAMTVFASLDIGLAFGVSCVVISILYLIINKYWKHLIRFLLIFLAIGGSIGITLGIIIYYHTGSIFRWLEAFLQTALANQNWAYITLGEYDKVIVGYFVLPLIVIYIFIKFIINIFMKNKGDYKNYIVLILFSAHILNISRILVRHSLVEHSIGVTIFLILISGCIFCLQYKRYRLTIFLVCLFLGSIFTNTDIYTSGISTAFTQEIDRNRVTTDFLYNHKDSVQAYTVNSEEIEQIRLLNILWNGTLSSNETYMDFANSTLLYAFTNRVNPVYVNQSPGLVNGEKGQLDFLEEIKAKKSQIPFVLMPYILDDNIVIRAELDTVLNSDRFYLITEYIGNNYRPFCIVGGYTVWCDIGRYQEMYNKAINNPEIMQVIQFIDSYSYNAQSCYSRDLGELPYVWANYDKVGINDLQTQLDLLQMPRLNDGYLIDWTKLDLSEGNYLTFTIYAQQNEDCILSLSGDTEQDAIVYKFNVKKGLNNYKIRISSDFQWYSRKLNLMRFNMNGGIVQISIKKGDIVN